MTNPVLSKKSNTKNHTQEMRPYFALNRNSAGFRKEIKSNTYTLVCDKSEGAFVYDIDGNQHIDLTMGFGSILFGHNYGPIREAIKEQLSKSWSVGPISPLAGKLAKEICEAVGVERTAFFNSGTEAVMVALRAAKAATKKKYIVYFKGSYHGTFDPLLSLKSSSTNNLAQEIVPGVTQSILNESYLLRFGDDRSLEFIKEHGNEIAAVLTEPVQSRNPGYQPVEFLKALRAVTAENNIALIFDEILTGFRMDIGGCQKLFGIKADMVTYGKVIGGGLPIGVVAGKAEYLDTLDGGFWHFDDDSVPSVRQTFVAGTFCHHPLAMAAGLKVLEILNNSGEEMISDLNDRTRLFCERMNSFFEKSGSGISISYFGSLFRFNTPGKSNLLYHQLLLNDVYIWEGRNCFLSPAHNDSIVATLEEKIKLSCQQLADMGIIKCSSNEQ